MSQAANLHPAARVLVVEDTPTQAELARVLLTTLGHEVRLASAAGPALIAAREWQPDAILLDVELPDYNGFELMKKLKAEGIDAAVVVVTANASINSAVEAMRGGAVDFIVKPYAKARLEVTLSNALEKRALVAQLRTVRARLERDRFFGFIGASAPMQAAYRTIESVAASRASVFITGESGTGKELAAEAIHKASPRAGAEYVALNCGAIPRDLLESEVFGHVKGAFTGATSDRAGAAKLADGGTLFLDEIGEMPLDMQVKLLRFVQTGTYAPVGSSRMERVDVRFVCATNRDPMAEVLAGRFREDLYYRLYVVPVELPPLRDRGDDVLRIARHFLTSFAREEGRRFRGFSPDAEAALLAYGWPGNVRQLQNAVRNVVVLHDGELVDAGMLPAPVVRPGAVAAPPGTAGTVPAELAMAAEPEKLAWLAAPPPAILPATPPPEPAPPFAVSHAAMPVEAAPGMAPVMPAATPVEMEVMPLAEMERRLVVAALRRTANDVPRAAALLQINPSTIYRKLTIWRAEGRIADM
jgi:two-component system repressor protein LuxO